MRAGKWTGIVLREEAEAGGIARLGHRNNENNDQQRISAAEEQGLEDGANGEAAPSYFRVDAEEEMSI